MDRGLLEAIGPNGLATAVEDLNLTLSKQDNSNLLLLVDTVNSKQQFSNNVPEYALYIALTAITLSIGATVALNNYLLLGFLLLASALFLV